MTFKAINVRCFLTWKIAEEIKKFLIGFFIKTELHFSHFSFPVNLNHQNIYEQNFVLKKCLSKIKYISKIKKRFSN